MTLVLNFLNAHKNMKTNKNELLIFRGNLKIIITGLVDRGLKQSQKQVKGGNKRWFFWLHTYIRDKIRWKWYVETFKILQNRRVISAIFNIFHSTIQSIFPFSGWFQLWHCYLQNPSQNYSFVGQLSIAQSLCNLRSRKYLVLFAIESENYIFFFGKV
jgi:hypothetical protein